MCYWKSKYKVFLNLLDSNASNVAMDILIISTEEIHKNNTWSWKSADTARNNWSFENPRKILGEVTKFHEIWMSY